MLKLAMIGAGGYAYELIKRIWTIPEKIELVAVSSNPLRKSAGRQACLDRSVEVYDNVDQLLEKVKGQCDVVFIPTPIHTHFSLTKRCIDNGFDVFLEKPPVATIQELDELASYASHHNKKVAVSFQSLYTTIMQEMKTRLVHGEFGEIKRVKGMAGWPRLDSYYNRSGWAGKLRVNGDWVLDGTINNPLAHMLSNELYLATRRADRMAEPITVQAELYHGHDIESEDTSSLRIWTDEDVEVIFNASLCSHSEMDPLIIVECEKATIEYSNFNMAMITFEDGKTDKIEDKSEQRTHMLSELSDSYKGLKPFAAMLETCRPFTLAVNGAFESCGGSHRIAQKYIERFEQGDTVKTVIKGIDHVLQVAHANGRLFSEMGVEWSVVSEKYDVTGYCRFPSKNFKSAKS
jgi:predicted dehydrogenase